jgi:hypothetical protein
LFLPLLISRLGGGTKRLWGAYTLGIAAFFLVFAVAGLLVALATDVMGETSTLRSAQDFAGGSFVFAICAFCGGSFAESAAGKMKRY